MRTTHARPKRRTRTLLGVVGIALTAGAILAAPLAAVAAPVYAVEDTIAITPGTIRYPHSLYNSVNESTYLLAGTGSNRVSVIAAGGTVTEFPLTNPQSMTLDDSGNVWVGGRDEASDHNLTRITPDLTLTTVIIPDVSGVAYNAFTGRVEVLSTKGIVSSVGADLSVIAWDADLEAMNSQIAVNASNGDVIVAGLRTLADSTQIRNFWAFSATGTELASYPDASQTANLAYNPTTERVYTTRTGHILSIAADLTSTEYASPGTGQAVTTALADGRVSVNYLGQNLVTLVGTDGSVTDLTVPFPGMAATDAHGASYQAIEGGVLITQADGTSSTLALASSSINAAVVFNAATGKVLVSGLNDGNVWVIGAANGPLITTPTVPNGNVGAAYTAQISATGDATITYAVTAGALPLGLTLDPATGAITGTPTTAGDATFTVTATNSVGADSKPFSMSVTAAAITPITVLTPSNGSTVDPSFTITGTGEFGSHVTMTNDSGVGSSAFDISNTDGSWSIGINPVFEPGTHTLTFTQDADGSVDTLTFTIAAAPVTPEPTTPASPSPADGKLSSTGADAAPLLLIGGLLAAAGVTAAVIGRKRRQRA